MRYVIYSGNGPFRRYWDGAELVQELTKAKRFSSIQLVRAGRDVDGAYPNGRWFRVARLVKKARHVIKKGGLYWVRGLYSGSVWSPVQKDAKRVSRTSEDGFECDGLGLLTELDERIVALKK